MAEAPEMVIPMESQPDPMHVTLTFKATNVSSIPVYVTAQLVTPPAGWSGYGELQCGTLAVGEDNYFLYDTPRRTKPATDTSESITLRVTYYKDAAYTLEYGHEDITYSLTYINFDDGSYTLVDADTFETGLEGWSRVNESGGAYIEQASDYVKTGSYAARFTISSATYIGYMTKSFTVPADAFTNGYIRFWLYTHVWVYGTGCAPVEYPMKYILEIITDAGGVTKKRTLPIAISGAPLGGPEIFDQWVCIASKIPIDGTYEVRLRMRCAFCYYRQLPSGCYIRTRLYLDDVKAVAK